MQTVHLRNILTNNTPQFTDAQKLNTLEGKGGRLGGVTSTTKTKPTLNNRVKIKGGFGQNPRTKGRFGDFGEGNIPGYRPVQKIQIPGTLLTLPMA